MKIYLFIIICVTAILARKHRFKNGTQRIVGGTYVDIRSYPYQVALAYWRSNQYEFQCGASLIGAKHVLTAGHCCKDFEKDKFLVKAGLDGYWNVLPDQMTYIAEIYIHEQFYSLYDAPINDIALIKLYQPFQLNSLVQVINLPSFGSVPSASLCAITGFGKTKISDPQPSPYLMKADVPIISNAECKVAVKILIPNVEPPIMDTNICTMSTPTKGSCAGDSGGPLAQDSVLIGVTSWGVSPCEADRNPTVYTQVSKYLGWIYQKMAL